MPEEFNRKSDLDNLNKIPVIETIVNLMREDLGDIKQSLNGYNGLKTDVVWLKKFFWIIAGTSISSILGLLITLTFKR